MYRQITQAEYFINECWYLWFEISTLHTTSRKKRSQHDCSLRHHKWHDSPLRTRPSAYLLQLRLLKHPLPWLLNKNNIADTSNDDYFGHTQQTIKLRKKFYIMCHSMNSGKITTLIQQKCRVQSKHLHMYAPCVQLNRWQTNDNIGRSYLPIFSAKLETS